MSPDRSGGGIKSTWYGQPIDTGASVGAGTVTGASNTANQTPVWGGFPAIKTLVLKIGPHTEKTYHNATEKLGVFTVFSQKITFADLAESGYKRLSSLLANEIIYQRTSVRVIIMVNGKETYNEQHKAYLYNNRTFTVEPQAVTEAMTPYAEEMISYMEYKQDPIGNWLVPLRDLTSLINKSIATCKIDWDNTGKIATVNIVENKKVGDHYYVFPVESHTDIHWSHSEGRDAIDIFAPEGSIVVAITSGVLTRVQNDTTGKTKNKRATLQLLGDDGKIYFHTHLRVNSPKEFGFATVSNGGTVRVNAGDSIGRVGNKKESDNTEEHLHISATPKGGKVDEHKGSWMKTLVKQLE